METSPPGFYLKQFSLLDYPHIRCLLGHFTYAHWIFCLMPQGRIGLSSRCWVSNQLAPWCLTACKPSSVSKIADSGPYIFSISKSPHLLLLAGASYLNILPSHPHAYYICAYHSPDLLLLSKGLSPWAPVLTFSLPCLLKNLGKIANHNPLSHISNLSFLVPSYQYF